MELIVDNNRNKNIILGKDLCWIAGTQKSNEEKVVVLPFIYNKDQTKIKVLTDNKIYNVNRNKNIFASEVLCSEYNLNDRLLGFKQYYSDSQKINLFVSIKPEEKVSEKKLQKIVKALKTTYMKVNNKLFKDKKIEEAKKNFEKSYKNF